MPKCDLGHIEMSDMSVKLKRRDFGDIFVTVVNDTNVRFLSRAIFLNLSNRKFNFYFEFDPIVHLDMTAL